jgi:hypothetical protein
MKYNVLIYKLLDIGDEYVGRIDFLDEVQKIQLTNLMWIIGFAVHIEEVNE